MEIDDVKEFFAATREDALAMASTHYGVDKGELEVKQLPGDLEISGLGERSVFLIWHPGSAPKGEGFRGAPRDRDRDRDRGHDRSRGRDRDRDRGQGRSRGHERDRDRGRGRGQARGRERDVGAREERRDDGEGPRRRGETSGRPEGVDDERLEALAQEAAERVRRSGEAEILESMNSKERWVVHNYLRTEEGVTSSSEGDGPAKRVKILPA